MARIALITSSFAPRIGGVEEHVAHVARELQAGGDDVSVWAVDQGDVKQENTGFPVRYLPCPLPARTLRAVGSFAAHVPAAFAAWREANRLDQPEFWHVQCFGPNGLYANALNGGQRLIYSHHGETFMDTVFEHSRLLRAGLARTLKRADAVTSCSSFAASDLDRFAAHAAIDIVPNGVDLDEPGGSPLAGLGARSYVLGIGRMVAVKGFDTLIRAYADGVRRGRIAGAIDLVLAGDGPDRSQLEALALTEGIASRVRFLGALDRPDVVAVMRDAALLIVPSRVEAFGITILEGWRAGIPVIATNHGGPAELISDGANGLLITPGDVSEVSRAMIKVLGDRALASSLGEQGRETVKTFTWSSAVDRYREVYERIAVRDRAARHV